MFTFLPVCSPRLVKDRSVTEGIAEDERMDSGRFVSVFSKLLGQKASQRSPKEMNLIGNKHKDRSCYVTAYRPILLTSLNFIVWMYHSLLSHSLIDGNLYSSSFLFFLPLQIYFWEHSCVSAPILVFLKVELLGQTICILISLMVLPKD